MATNYRTGDTPLNGANVEQKDSYESTMGGQNDPEKHAVPPTRGYKGKEDPFGDETNAEVKYKTMKWW